MTTFRDQLDGVIKARHLLNHSFYTRWQKGQLSKRELQGYAKEYYAFEKEFPRYISALHSRCEDAKIRQHLLNNLVDEEGGEENHVKLWQQFAHGMGVTQTELDEHFRSDETENLLRVFRKHTNSEHISDGVAALYAYEAQQPEVAKEKISGLKKFYGVSSESVTKFFNVNQTYDVQHADAEAAVLDALCADQESQDRSLAVTKEVVDALYDFLSGVENRYGDGEVKSCH